MIALRKQHPRLRPRLASSSSAPTTGRCSPTSGAYENETILCVANLSRTRAAGRARSRRAFAGLMPVEMLGQTEFPRIGDQPYFLTLGALRLLLVPAAGDGCRA